MTGKVVSRFFLLLNLNNSNRIEYLVIGGCLVYFRRDGDKDNKN